MPENEDANALLGAQAISRHQCLGLNPVVDRREHRPLKLSLSMHTQNQEEEL